MISKVEMWIMNPKVSRVAQELLMTVAMSCNTYTQIDIEVLVLFSKLRYEKKNKIAFRHLYSQYAVIKQARK